ncbi:GAF domain-containing protein [Streptomyces sp. NPDC004539]|uniref:GAF domain-containing protein n=1 Tax=Streptomyces sp. NPDC004539 TaxID=3154280 RepID=UPI0033AE4699
MNHHPQHHPPSPPGSEHGVLRLPRQPLAPDGIVLGSEARQAALRERTALVEQLGLPLDGHPLFDDFAALLARRTGMAYGFVNIVLEEQTFIGLHQPSPGSGYPVVGRTMSTDHGWCPYVIDRQKALPLPNVHARPRYSANFVAETVGISSYFGAPLIHTASGITLGTVCTIDPEERPLSDAARLRDIVVAVGAEVLEAITSRAAIG